MARSCSGNAQEAGPSPRSSCRCRDRHWAPECGAGTRHEALVTVPRPSTHQEPHGPTAIARHYIRDLIYGANDGLITTFAVVAGVSGGALSSRAVIIIG